MDFLYKWQRLFGFRVDSNDAIDRMYSICVALRKGIFFTLCFPESQGAVEKIKDLDTLLKGIMNTKAKKGFELNCSDYYGCFYDAFSGGLYYTKKVYADEFKEEGYPVDDIDSDATWDKMHKIIKIICKQMEKKKFRGIKNIVNTVS